MSEADTPIETEPQSMECPFDIEMCKDDRGRDATFGYGAWSTVYKAKCKAKSRKLSEPLTPPLSPTVAMSGLVAVKKPARKDAVAILLSEASILDHLRRVRQHEKFVVTFLGIIDETSIVMEAIPASLEDHIRNCARAAIQNRSPWDTEPVVGSVATWFQLAQQLIAALAWLHDIAQVVHGDIKPGNILLSRVSGSGTDISFTPMFADFSSSQRLDLDEITPNTLSAVTREYTAPELLSSKVLRDPQSTATRASDVFSMAITLLVAATGQLTVYPGSVFQRQAMATQGWQALNHVRNGDGGTRVPRCGKVERVLERAVLKADLGRISASQWKKLVEDMGKGEPAKI
jgi:serine/threonine protein kinase